MKEEDEGESEALTRRATEPSLQVAASCWPLALKQTDVAMAPNTAA